MTPHATSFFRSLVEWVLIFVIAIAAMLVVRAFVLEPYVVPTGSMEPTIEIGDQVFAQKVTCNLGQSPAAGDIVVFRNPDGSSDHDVLVKRVIATAGQTVDLVDGRVVVDGQVLDAALRGRGELAARQPGPRDHRELPLHRAGGVRLGDGRQPRELRRLALLGAVEQQDLIGVAVLRYWPLNRFGLL